MLKEKQSFAKKGINVSLFFKKKGKFVINLLKKRIQTNSLPNPDPHQAINYRVKESSVYFTSYLNDFLGSVIL